MTTITREVLADHLAERAQITKVAAREEVKWFFDTLSTAVLAGDEVRIHGFGTFKAVARSASTRRNPRTGEPVQVPAHRAVRFVPSTTVSAALRSGGVKKSSGRKAKK
ncbi:MAG TPA: HU family DNA-binding protein [Candidatus Dormibacteraeota bacterium]|nr:HU family DNA-binding protein [Candidatus Dormibacteraeota bacterium]